VALRIASKTKIMELNVSTKIRIHGLGYPTANPPKIMNATKQIVDQRTVDARGIPSFRGVNILEYTRISSAKYIICGGDGCRYSGARFLQSPR
jgi:hypothetical protein